MSFRMRITGRVSWRNVRYTAGSSATAIEGSSAKLSALSPSFGLLLKMAPNISSHCLRIRTDRSSASIFLTASSTDRAKG